MMHRCVIGWQRAKSHQWVAHCTQEVQMCCATIPQEDIQVTAKQNQKHFSYIDLVLANKELPVLEIYHHRIYLY